MLPDKASILLCTVVNPKLGYDEELWRRYNVKKQTRRPDEVWMEPDKEETDYWDTNVSLARERCRQRFLQSKHTHLLFVDLDVWMCRKGLKLLLKLDKPIVAGKYLHKEDKVPFLWYYEYVPPERRLETAKRYGKPVILEDVFYTGNQPRPINKAGTGCLLIKREVAEKVPFPKEVPKEWTEDVIWSVTANQVHGYEIWAQPKCLCQHVGPSHQPLKIEKRGMPTR